MRRQDRLFAATGDLLQLVVLDRVNASHLTAYNLDASLGDVTVIDDVIDDPTHGQYAGQTFLCATVRRAEFLNELLKRTRKPTRLKMVENDTSPGVQIYLRPCVRLTFDLLTHKFDHFVPLRSGLLAAAMGIKLASFFFLQNIVFIIWQQTNERLNGQVENIMARRASRSGRGIIKDFCAVAILRTHFEDIKRSDHITDLLVSFHWLRVPERTQCKIAVLSYKVLHDTAPRHLGSLTRVADIPGRRALRSASTNRLDVPHFKLSFPI